MKIEIYDSKDGVRWRLKAANGEILANSEAYKQPASCLKTVNMIQKEVASMITTALTMIAGYPKFACNAKGEEKCNIPQIPGVEVVDKRAKRNAKKKS